MWAQQAQLSLLPAPADSPPSGGCLPSSVLFSGSAVAEKGGREVAGWVPSIKVGLQAFIFNLSGPLIVSSLRAPGPQLDGSLCRKISHGIPRFRHRRIARPRECVFKCRPFFLDQRLRRKAAEKLQAGSLRSKSDFKLLTLIKVGSFIKLFNTK